MIKKGEKHTKETKEKMKRSAQIRWIIKNANKLKKQVSLSSKRGSKNE